MYVDGCFCFIFVSPVLCHTTHLSVVRLVKKCSVLLKKCTKTGGLSAQVVALSPNPITTKKRYQMLIAVTAQE
jgi:hypothetical protein